MDWKTIVDFLEQKGLVATLAALNRAVKEDAVLLAGPVERTEFFDACAQQLYAKAITWAFKNPQPLTPGVILSSRRTAAAWAISQILLDAGFRE